MSELKQIEGKDQVKASLMELPKGARGILFVEYGSIEPRNIVDAGLSDYCRLNDVNVIIVMCRDVEGLKYIPFEKD